MNNTVFLKGAKYLLAAAFALGLVACGRQQENTASGPAAAKQTTITVLVWAPDWPDEMHRIAAEFSKLHPLVKVDVQFMIGNSVEENIKPKVAANDLPDVMSINPNAYAAELAEQGFLADLGQLAAWDNMQDNLKPDWTARSGKRFGLSGGVAATLMYYNKALFKQAGIKKLPEDFPEFLAVCEQLKSHGITPIMWNGGFPNMLGNGPFSFGFANAVVARSPDWKQGIGDGSLNLDTPEAADIFAKIKLVADRGYVQPGYMSTRYDDGIKLFTDGKTAMAFHGTWASGRLMHGSGFETGTFIPPWNAAGKKVVPVIGNETGFALVETKNKAAATEFLEFMFGPGFSIYQNKRQNVSPLKKMAGPAVSDPQINAYVRQIETYPVTGRPYYSFLPASTLDLLHPLMQDVLVGKVTPRQAARRLDESIKNEARANNK